MIHYRYQPVVADKSDCKITLTKGVLRYPVGPFVKGSIKSNLMMLFGHREMKGPDVSYYTALKGVDLSIRAGERVGIIGRNGAGKSTLLRAIAGIYPLEEGDLEVHGKIQSLFDIGIGFEAESTGRENILYRGLAMGSDPARIAEREQDIIDFAAIGEFIDMPIRMYSAGMTVRLAFAISSYLDGDILLIDEVFGAGDAAFQEKAIARMNNLVTEASIVVFVSHDIHTMKTLVNRVIWLDKGLIRADGPAGDVIDEYLTEIHKGAA
jgi:lipopolysaccharide transport system ATP-binding protein